MPRTDLADTNRVQADDLAGHRWYRFVLSFPPHLVRRYVERFGLSPDHVVLDPFCGTGTTLVECKKLGIPSIGVERNPIAAFASRIKVDWALHPRDLLDDAQRVAQLAGERLDKDGVGDLSDLPLFSSDQSNPAELQALSPDVEKLLLKGSMSPRPLHKTLVLLDAIRKEGHLRFQGHELLALARAIHSAIGNLHFGPEVGVGPPKVDAPAVTIWSEIVREIADDLAVLREKQSTTSLVWEADSRELSAILPANSVDCVITSPPYPNEKDYTRTTRLESVLLGFIRTKEDLRSLKRDLVKSNTRAVYKADTDDSFLVGNQDVDAIARAIDQRRRELGKTSGFERLYSRVTRLYFGGMARHLLHLRSVLRPGAQLAYVVGDQASYLRVMIRTGQLLGKIAQSLGYEVMGTELFRTRRATATNTNLREEVLLLRWAG